MADKDRLLMFYLVLSDGKILRTAITDQGRVTIYQLLCTSYISSFDSGLRIGNSSF
jgi:hypothetical protein